MSIYPEGYSTQGFLDDLTASPKQVGRGGRTPPLSHSISKELEASSKVLETTVDAYGLT